MRNLELSTLPTEYGTYYLQFEQYATRAFKLLSNIGTNVPLEPQLHYALDADPSVNARAYSIDSDHHVRLHIGLPVIVHYACNLVMGFPSMFPTVGDPASQSGFDPVGMIPGSLPDDVDPAQATLFILGRSRPVDDERAAFAALLAEIAISFSVFHEIAHIACGHTAAKPGELCEFTTSKPWLSLFGPSLAQVWEFEADIHAAYMLGSSVLHSDNRPRYEAFGIDASKFGIERVALSSLNVALFVLFSVLDLSASRTRWSSHPKPFTRLMSVLDELRNANASLIGPLVPDQSAIDTAFTQSLNTVVDVWSQLELAKGHRALPAHLVRARRDQKQLQHALHHRRARYSASSWGISLLVTE